MQVTIDTNNTAAGPFDTDESYVQFVMAMAAESYMKQHGTDTPDAGISAARATYNASFSSEE